MTRTAPTPPLTTTPAEAARAVDLVPGSALRDPFFLGALALLLLNDHLLKGSGLLPGWLTGKLSDFSWLVVAPVALAVLLGLRRRGALAMLLGCVTALFVATELSQSFADSVAAVASGLGQPTRLWADPTDLIALSILPVTWHLLARRAGVERSHRGAARLVAHVALGSAIFASVATSSPPPPRPSSWATSAYVANTTSTPISVRLRFAEAGLDCSLLGSVDLSAAVARDLFDTGITFRLGPQETVPIEPQAATFAATGGPPGATPMPANPCDLVLLSTDGAPDTIVLVAGDRGSAPTTLGSGALDTLGTGARVDIALTATGAPEFRVGTALRSALLDDRTPPSDCTLDRAPFAHNVGSHFGSYTLLTSAVGADGCIATTMSEVDSRTWTFFFCAPESYFPFAPGDALTIAGPITTAPGVRVSGPAGTLTLLDEETTSLQAPPFVVEAEAVEACAGQREACGAFVIPRTASVTLASGTPAGRSGDDYTGTSRAGTPARLRLGAVESTVIAPAACDATRSAAGPRTSAVLFVE